jgi:hypothetical protein
MNKGCFFALCCLLSMSVAIKAEAVEAEKSIKKIKKEYYVVVDAQKIITDTGLDKDATQELTNLQQKYQKDR